ncbi:hypothetical protein T484DRAFT_1944649 [Baffinella frigidus]|nr:hypothetical protein T484DRAFT_1944649 [Cryptophyta sp. CCMP2293]
MGLPPASRGPTRAALCVLAACSLVACALLVVGGAGGFGDAGVLLLSRQDAGGQALTAKSEKVYTRIEKMNARLRDENQNLHSLLRRDESENMHVESKLHHQVDAEHSRREEAQDKVKSLRQQLDDILGGGGDSGAGGSGDSAAPVSGVSTDRAAANLLKQATVEADQQLGVQHRAASVVLKHDFVADAPVEEQQRVRARREDSRASEEREEEDRAEQRRALTRSERRRYDAEMRRSERDIRNGHPYRAREEARHALEMHQREQQLRGFEGKEERKAPKAWGLLHQTIQDDIKDRVQSRRVEDNMANVVQLRHDVDSAKHQYNEEKHDLGRFAGGRMGLMLEAPTSGGGFSAEKEITNKLDTELNDEERAWDRADALEAAKAAAADELHAAEGGGVPAARPHPMARARVVMPAPPPPSGQVGASVPFIPRTFWQGENFVGKTAREINKDGPHADTNAAQARKSQLALMKGSAGGGPLYGQGVASAAKGKYVLNKKHVRYIGAAKGLPGQPAEVANDIVERLLKLAHSGKLKSPEDHPALVKHPMSAAIADHQADQRHLLKADEARREAQAQASRSGALPPPRAFARGRGRGASGGGGVQGGEAAKPGGLWGFVDGVFGDSSVHKTYLPE